MAMQLQDAINNIKKLEDLFPVAQQMTAKLSFWGNQYVVIDSKLGNLKYEGIAPLNALLTRISDIIEASGKARYAIKTFTNSEHKICHSLEIQVKRIYQQDWDLYNKSSIITKIFVIIRSVFHGNYQREWTGYDYGYNIDGYGRKQILERDGEYEWDDNVKDYVHPEFGKLFEKHEKELQKDQESAKIKRTYITPTGEKVTLLTSRKSSKL